MQMTRLKAICTMLHRESPRKNRKESHVLLKFVWQVKIVRSLSNVRPRKESVRISKNPKNPVFLSPESFRIWNYIWKNPSNKDAWRIPKNPFRIVKNLHSCRFVQISLKYRKNISILIDFDRWKLFAVFLMWWLQLAGTAAPATATPATPLRYDGSTSWAKATRTFRMHPARICRSTNATSCAGVSSASRSYRFALIAFNYSWIRATARRSWSWTNPPMNRWIYSAAGLLKKWQKMFKN